MDISPLVVKEYHIFVASPSDMNEERDAVRQFFSEYNQNIARLWGVRFEVVDSDNYSTIGVGRPQEMITHQTLETFKDSLVLVIGLMGQRFGTPTGVAESGTEEEYNWALKSNQQRGFPEIKWFFRKYENITVPEDPESAMGSLEQWKKVREFKKRMKESEPPVYYKEFTDINNFEGVFRVDLSKWLSHPDRPWSLRKSELKGVEQTALSSTLQYYQNLYDDFHRLDIAGIDSDRTFEIPLTDIYVRLRIIFEEDREEGDIDELSDGGAIDIKTALERYNRLVIVGDPGSGKSTFLKYITLMIARSILESNPVIALTSLSIEVPLPIPIIVSCWDLSDYLKKQTDAKLRELMNFIVERLGNFGYSINYDDLEKLLSNGECYLMFDGLDEVPTEHGRAIVSRLLEDCVKNYEKNRYIVTSRVRAYTGDTILKEGFTRCDIQPFNEEDRRQFLRNWVSLLFKKKPEDVLEIGGEARREFDSLAKGIESSERIRILAVNPLLLTVIAIVHWNRKRLPEQRVDLYDECIDVLLGQRKEAEHTQILRGKEAFNERYEERELEGRSWIRKRFAEVALRILLTEGEEITKTDIIALLIPRFLDKGASNVEQATAQAELFLKRQELRSGLLVSRRAGSYRFVHLTFQEYLTAWHISKQEFEETIKIIKPHLREQKWFETLQLLGGEWAKDSDEIVDKYIRWLIEYRGKTITDQAPIVALCANIVNDISGIAELKTSTRRLYEEVIGKTLRAFRPRSGVAEKTQLEILEALARLGPAAKGYLITATKASYYPIRSRAINLLLPHLSDDELYSMSHILDDQSKRPIKAYLVALWDRDPVRTIRLLEGKNIIENQLKYNRLIQAIAHLLTLEYEYLPKSEFLQSCWEMVWEDVLQGVEGWQTRLALLKTLVHLYPDKEDTWVKVRNMARNDFSIMVKREAMIILDQYRGDDKKTIQVYLEAVQGRDKYDYYSTLSMSDLVLKLLASKLEDEIDKKLVLRYLREIKPTLYPMETIKRSDISVVAKQLKLSEGDLISRYKILSNRFPGLIRLDTSL